MIITRNPGRRRSRGAAMAEFLVTLPALLALGLGGMQSLFWYHAKTTLDYATFEAARVGAVTHAQRSRMRQELGLRLAPLFGGDGSPSSALRAIGRSGADVLDPRFTQIEILNPSREAFEDFGVKNPKNNKTEIPNDNLRHRPREVKAKSGVNIQDANLLKIKTTYGYELKVPLIDRIVPALLKLTDPKHILYYDAGRIPLVSYATVRMQSPAWPDGNASAGGGPGGGVVPGNGDPGEGQPPGGDGDSTGGDNTNGPGGDGTGDTGTGNTNPGTGGDGGTGPGGNPGNNPGDSTPGDPAEELLCENTTPEDDNQGAPETDQGFWGDLWDGIKDGAIYGYEFMKGFWEGIKDQIIDLANLVLHPIDTAKGLIELGKAFYDDPVGTVKMIGEALGKDLSQLVNCGAYDRGLVIGRYVSPAFMVKLATKLAKFGSFRKLTQALDETKKDFGCASFAAGTGVWTPQGAVSIETLEVKASVFSRDEHSFDDASQSVEKLFRRTAPEYFLLTTESEQLKVTAEHPLWKQGAGWTEAKELKVDDIVASAEGDVLILDNQRIEAPLKVYNFSVANTHNYFVGEGKLWAHNSKCELEFINGVRYTSVKIESFNGKNKALNNPQALTVYRVNGRHTFRTDEKGRVVEATSTVQLKDLDTTARNYYQQCKIGKCGVTGDEGGHLIATKLGGPGEAINLVPQNMNLNRSAWKKMEIEWGIAALEGKTIEINIKPIYSGDSVRPDSFDVIYRIDGVTTIKNFVNQPGG